MVDSQSDKFNRWEVLESLDAGDPYLRRNFIGASDVPIIMGVSPYGTPYQLWQEKCGIRQRSVNKFITDKGHEKEIEARKIVEAQFECDFPPKRFFSKELDFLMCSLDGFCQQKKEAIEIKFVGKEDYALALNDIIPQRYYPQLQTQMWVCGLDQIKYVSFMSKEINSCITCKRSDAYIACIRDAIIDFWDKVQTLTPPPLCDRDFLEKTDEYWKFLAEKLSIITKEKIELESEESRIRNELIRISGDYNCEGFGVRTKKIVKKGAIDYSRIESIKNLDLEQFRKEQSEYWKITVTEIEE